MKFIYFIILLMLFPVLCLALTIDQESPGYTVYNSQGELLAEFSNDNVSTDTIDALSLLYGLQSFDAPFKQEYDLQLGKDIPVKVAIDDTGKSQLVDYGLTFFGGLIGGALIALFSFKLTKKQFSKNAKEQLVYQRAYTFYFDMIIPLLSSTDRLIFIAKQIINNEIGQDDVKDVTINTKIQGGDSYIVEKAIFKKCLLDAERNGLIILTHYLMGIDKKFSVNYTTYCTLLVYKFRADRDDEVDHLSIRDFHNELLKTGLPDVMEALRLMEERDDVVTLDDAKKL